MIQRAPGRMVGRVGLCEEVIPELRCSVMRCDEKGH